MMKLSSLIVILVLFSSSLFAEDWGLSNDKIGDMLEAGYELKEVTVDPAFAKEGLYRIFYHFISYEKQVMVICQVDIDYGTPKGTWCYSSPQ